MSKQTDIDIELVVATREDIAESVVGLHLEYPDGTPLPNWTPGSHIDVVLNEELVRQYSLVELDEDASRWHIGVLREVEGRGGSREIHDTIAPGMKIRARGPRNHFQLQPADGYIFIAGGIGITPITSMIAEAERRATPWKLTYGGRTRASMAFSEDLVERYGERVSLVPQDELGLIDLDAILGSPGRESSSIAAARARCSTPFSGLPRTGPRTRSTSSGSSLSTRKGRGRTTPSKSNSTRAESWSTCRRTSRYSGCSTKPESMSSLRVEKAHAVPARR